MSDLLEEPKSPTLRKRVRIRKDKEKYNQTEALRRKEQSDRFDQLREVIECQVQSRSQLLTAAVEYIKRLKARLAEQSLTQAQPLSPTSLSAHSSPSASYGSPSPPPPPPPPVPPSASSSSISSTPPSVQGPQPPSIYSPRASPLLASLPAASVAVTGSLIDANSAFVALFGMSSYEQINSLTSAPLVNSRSIYSLVHPSDVTRVYHHFQDVLKVSRQSQHAQLQPGSHYDEEHSTIFRWLVPCMTTQSETFLVDMIITPVRDNETGNLRKFFFLFLPHPDNGQQNTRQLLPEYPARYPIKDPRDEKAAPQYSISAAPLQPAVELPPLRYVSDDLPPLPVLPLVIPSLAQRLPLTITSTTQQQQNNQLSPNSIFLRTLQNNNNNMSDSIPIVNYAIQADEYEEYDWNQSPRMSD